MTEDENTRLIRVQAMRVEKLAARVLLLERLVWNMADELLCDIPWVVGVEDLERRVRDAKKREKEAALA